MVWDEAGIQERMQKGEIWKAGRREFFGGASASQDVVRSTGLAMGGARVHFRAMGFFDRLLGRAPQRSDPTRAWDSLQPPMPDFDVERMAFGPLRFGDPLDAAAFLGRPDHFAWTQPDYGTLLYGSRGFEVDFDAGRFAYVALFIGPDAGLPKEVPITFSEPCLTGLSNGPLRLTRSLDRAAVERWFGPGESDVENGDETILFYQRQGVEMEFEFDGRSGELKRWNAFPWDLDSQGRR